MMLIVPTWHWKLLCVEYACLTISSYKCHWECEKWKIKGTLYASLVQLKSKELNRSNAGEFTETQAFLLGLVWIWPSEGHICICQGYWFICLLILIKSHNNPAYDLLLPDSHVALVQTLFGLEAVIFCHPSLGWEYRHVLPHPVLYISPCFSWFITRLNILLLYNTEPLLVLTFIHANPTHCINQSFCQWRFIHSYQNLEATKISFKYMKK